MTLEELDFLFREIDGGFHLDHDVEQLLAEVADIFRQFTADLIQRQLRALHGPGANEIEYRLGLGEIDATIQKSPLGEFAGFRLARAVSQD